MGTQEMGFFILNPTNKLGLKAMSSTSMGASALHLLKWTSYVWAGGGHNAQMFWQIGLSGKNVLMCFVKLSGRMQEAEPKGLPRLLSGSRSIRDFSVPLGAPWGC